jgi:DNA processing protein
MGPCDTLEEMPPDEKRRAYHALARAVHGDHGALSKLHKAHGRWPAPGSHEGTDEAWKDLEKKGVGLVLADDPGYPASLREIPLFPWGLYHQGDLAPLALPAIAIVGTRKATDGARLLAREFAAAFARAGLTVVSGLAFGIDAAAHMGALQGEGPTVAVLANGLPQVYPAHHAELAREILRKGGALVSEYPPGEPPLPRRFLERNRIVSGLTRGIVVIEAPERSGSLATARFALEQNREVFVIPGPPKHPNYGGSHRLIREGAELVTSPEEVLRALGVEPSDPGAGSPPSEGEESIILAALARSSSPLTIDRIIELTHLEPHVALRTVSLLIIKKRLCESGGRYMVC